VECEGGLNRGVWSVRGVWDEAGWGKGKGQRGSGGWR